jgi:hypothetical protein
VQYQSTRLQGSENSYHPSPFVTIGMQVFGVAADHAGTTLVVVDGACGATHLLPWPLPGMPLLQ